MTNWKHVDANNPVCDKLVYLWFPDFTGNEATVGERRKVEIFDDVYGDEWVDQWNNDTFETSGGRVEPSHWAEIEPPDTQEG